MDRYNLKTEIAAVGSVKKLADLLIDLTDQSTFYLEPYPIYRKYSQNQSFYVMQVDKETQKKVCCGSIELVQSKDHKVVLKLDSTRGVKNHQHQKNHLPLERFFYLIVQRLVQQDLLAKKR